MYVGMYVCMYVCIYECMYLCVYMYVYVGTCEFVICTNVCKLVSHPVGILGYLIHALCVCVYVSCMCFSECMHIYLILIYTGETGKEYS